MSLIKVKVMDTLVTEREGVSRSGRPYKIRAQENVYVELNGEVRKVAINLQENMSAYAPGAYTLDPVSLIRVGRYGFELDSFKQIVLVPLSTSQLSMSKVA